LQEQQLREQALKLQQQKDLQQKSQKDRQANDALEKMLQDAERNRQQEAQRLANEQKASRERAVAEKQAADKQAAEKQAADRQSAERQAAERAQQRGLADYKAKIIGKVRGNLVYNEEGAPNPTAQFEISQLPTGEVVNINRMRSSGNRAYDEAIERAIYKSSPLPKPDNAALFERVLIVSFKLRD
jgi:colicin import membrane protein